MLRVTTDLKTQGRFINSRSCSSLPFPAFLCRFLKTSEILSDCKNLTFKAQVNPYNILLLMRGNVADISVSSSWFAGKVLDASLILTQPFSTAEQVVEKIFSLGNSNISVSFVWFSAGMTACGVANLNVGPSRNAVFMISKIHQVAGFSHLIAENGHVFLLGIFKNEQ